MSSGSPRLFPVTRLSERKHFERRFRRHMCRHFSTSTSAMPGLRWPNSTPQCPSASLRFIYYLLKSHYVVRRPTGGAGKHSASPFTSTDGYGFPPYPETRGPRLKAQCAGTTRNKLDLCLMPIGYGPGNSKFGRLGSVAHLIPTLSTTEPGRRMSRWDGSIPVGTLQLALPENPCRATGTGE